MGKKKKSVDPSLILKKYMNEVGDSKKDLYKQYKNLLDDIEYAQYRGFELDKMAKKDTKRRINKKEKEFYDEMKNLKRRRKDIKNDSKSTGYIDGFLKSMEQIMPAIKLCAKLVMVAIISILSIDFIQRGISPEMLRKITAIFQVAMKV